MFKQLVVGLLVVSMVSAKNVAEEKTDPQDPTWRRAIVVGLAAAPAYPGDDGVQGTALPDFRAEYGDRFSASLLTGVIYNLVQSKHWQFGPMLRYDWGRDEEDGNPLVLFGDEITDLLGLGDLDGSVEVGVFFGFERNQWSARAEVRQGLDGGHEGLVGRVALSRSGQVELFGQTGFYSIGPEVVLGDETYLQEYFGITAAQSAGSGLEIYTPDAGIVSAGVQSNVYFPLGRTWGVGAFANINFLGDNAGDSSLVVERGSDTQVMGGITVVYNF